MKDYNIAQFPKLENLVDYILDKNAGWYEYVNYDSKKYLIFIRLDGKGEKEFVFRELLN